MLNKITGLKTEGSGFDSGQVREIFPVSKMSKTSLGLTYLTGYGNSLREVEATGLSSLPQKRDHVTRKRMYGALSPFPPVFLCCGVYA